MQEQKPLPLVSIIILNFNGKDYLEKCVSSVLETKYNNFEAILVDNASTDDSLASIESSFGSDKRLRVIRNTKNLGFAGGNNIGFSYARGSYIAFLNNDTTVDPYWLTHLVDVLIKDKTVGLAQSLLLTGDGAEIDSGGFLLSEYLVGQHSIREKKIIHDFPYFEVSAATGAAMIVDRKICGKMGLFDPLLPFYYDDVFISLKTWLMGKRVVTVPNSIVYHAGSKATMAIARDQQALIYFSIFHSMRAKICLIIDTYYKFSDLIKGLFVLSFSLSELFLFGLLTKNRASVFAELCGLNWILKNFGHIWYTRLLLWNRSKISPQTLSAKFIRIRLPFSTYLLPAKKRNQYLFLAALKYERLLIDSLKESQ